MLNSGADCAAVECELQYRIKYAGILGHAAYGAVLRMAHDDVVARGSHFAQDETQLLERRVLASSLKDVMKPTPTEGSEALRGLWV